MSFDPTYEELKLCLDEAHIDLSSRDFNTNNVKFFTNIVFYLRKLRCTLVMTSPLIENIDSRVRNVTNLYCPVRNDRNYFYYPFYDYQLEKYLKTKRIRKIDAFKISEQIFDTYSMVTPLEYPSSRQEFIDLLEQLKRENALYLARKASTTA